MNTISQICGNFPTNLEESSENPENYINILRTLNVPLLSNNDYIFNWKGYRRKKLNYFAEVLTDVGVCLSFNHLSETEIFKSKSLSAKFLREVSVNGPSDRSLLDYYLERGYSDDFDCKSYPLRSLDSAADLGFQFNIEFLKETLNITCSGLRGFKVALHFPGEWPRIKQQFIEVPLNKKASITVKPQVIYTSKSLKSYKPGARQCFYQNERSLKFFKIYTKANCEFECIVNFTLNVCGCVAFYMPSELKIFC